MGFSISIEDVRVASDRIAGNVLRTPLIRSEVLSNRFGCDLYFKAENLQYAGAFKARGACNAVFSLDDSIAERGVVTHSSGNHAAALARAATLRGIPVHVVMPENSSRTKIEAVRGYGVEPVFCEPTASARAEAAERIRSRTDATLIHPYNDPMVMAGQGTVGLEIMEQLPDVDIVCAPVGGGGLLSGTLIAIKSCYPQVRVVGAEPAWADDAYRSLRSGRLEKPNRVDTIADGLRTPLGENPFPIIQKWVDDIQLVSESAIRNATRIMAETVRLVAEPSGAVSLAAVQSKAAFFQGQRVVCVVSGGNMDFGRCQLGTETK